MPKSSTGPRHHATSEYEFSQEETEFLAAMQEFKARTGKLFPTWTDALHVLERLGYVKPIFDDDDAVEYDFYAA